jgi:adenosylcobinamide amidohydrolase
LKKHSISLNRLKGKLPAGKTGAPGTPGTPGAPGAPGTALAYAHVNADGTLDAANSKNVDRTSGIATAGYYCIQTSVPVHNVVVTPDSPTVARTATAGKSDPFTSCGAFDPTKPRGDVVVTTFSGTTATNTAFWIAIN